MSYVVSKCLIFLTLRSEMSRVRWEWKRSRHSAATDVAEASPPPPRHFACRMVNVNPPETPKHHMKQQYCQITNALWTPRIVSASHTPTQRHCLSKQFQCFPCFRNSSNAGPALDWPSACHSGAPAPVMESVHERRRPAALVAACSRVGSAAHNRLVITGPALLSRLWFTAMGLMSRAGRRRRSAAPSVHQCRQVTCSRNAGQWPRIHEQKNSKV